MLASLRFQVGLLALLQALLLTNNVTLIAVNGLAGMALAADKAFATVPVTSYVVGAALASLPAAALMRRLGRRAGYSAGSLAAVAGAALSAWGVQAGSLALLCAGTFVCGIYNAFGASYRFAAVDAADAYRPDFRARAISLVLAGGIAGGIIGPELSKRTIDALPWHFAGAYLSLAGFAIASLLLAQLLRLPGPREAAAAGPARPLAAILAQPRCWIAVGSAALAYGVMNLLMVATPLAMAVCSHPYAAAATVLEWHVVGMFAPGLFSGALIARVGALPVIAAGCALMLGCAGIALSGVSVPHFAAALALLGVGWNFMYTGATALLTTCYAPAEKNKVQGFNDLVVFATMISSSLSSGVLLHANGWSLLNLLAVPLVLAVLAGCGWLVGREGWRLDAPARPAG